MNNNKNRASTSALLLPLLCALPMANQAVAQPTKSNADIEVIEVKSLRQAYRGNVKAKDLPQSIATISFDELELTGVTNLQDSLEYVSGVTRQNDFGGLWDMFAIRGFAGDENLPSAYLINGFSAGRGFSGNRDISNVQVIEVLKGPSSALYGRGEPGGTVNIITKKPEFEQIGYVKLGAASFNSYRAEGDFTTALTEDLAFRINGAYDDAESYRDHVTKKKTVLTPSFTYLAGDKTTISYELEYLDQEVTMDRGVVVVDGKPFSSSRFYGEPADGPVEIKATGHQLQLQHELSGDWVLTAGLSYRTSSFEGNATEPRWYDSSDNKVVRQRRYRDFDAEDVSGRFEFSGSVDLFGFQHNLLIGGDAYDYQLDRTILRYRHNTAPDGSEQSDSKYYAVDYDKPVYRDALPDMIDNTSDLEEQNGQGVYFQDQIDLSDKWKAMFGVRFDNFEQDITNRLASNKKTSVSKSYLNPRFGLVYEMTDEARLYTSYSEGARPNSGVDTNGNGHDPEKSKSWEVGVKWDLADNGFRGTSAIFTTTKENILASNPSGDGSTAAIGEAESKGFELDMSYDITASTQLSMSYAYVDAQNSKEIKLWDWYVIEKGARLGNVPEHSGHVMLRQFVEFSGYEGSGGFVVRYVGDQMGDFLQQDFELPSYTLVNLFANVNLSNNLELNLNINNLLDEEYYANSYMDEWTMPGAPRSFNASVKYSF